MAWIVSLLSQYGKRKVSRKEKTNRAVNEKGYQLICASPDEEGEGKKSRKLGIKTFSGKELKEKEILSSGSGAVYDSTLRAGDHF